MKKKLALSFLIIAYSFTSIYSYAKSKLSVSIADSYKTFKVVINDIEFYNSYTSNSLTIKNIPAGSYKLKVYYAKRRQHNNDFLGNSSRDWEPTLLLNKTVIIKHNYHYDIIFSRFGKVFSDQTPILFQTKNADDSDEKELDFLTSSNEIPFTDNEEKMEWIGTAPVSTGNIPATRTNYKPKMYTKDYEQLKEMIKKENFSDSKLRLIKEATKSRWINANQAKELGMLFSMETDKVEYAKYSYSRVIDKKSFFIIYDIFKTSYSKEELSEYLKTQENSFNNTMDVQEFEESEGWKSTEEGKAFYQHPRLLISEASYDQLQERVKKEPLSINKLKLIKEATQFTWVTPYQAKELGNTFSTEEDKISYAKYIYPRINKKNAYILFEIFQMPSSKEEVYKYLNSLENK